MDGRDGDASRPLNVLIVYENLAAGQQAMRLCRDLAWQQDGDFCFHPRLWRLDVVAEPVCGGFAIADAVQADLLIVSTSNQAKVSEPAQHWLKLCLAVARKSDTCPAIIALFGTNGQFNEAYFSNLQFLRNLAREAEVELFVPFANRKEDVRAKPRTASEAHAGLAEATAAAALQMAQASQPSMLRAYGPKTNYRERGIND